MKIKHCNKQNKKINLQKENKKQCLFIKQKVIKQQPVWILLLCLCLFYSAFIDLVYNKQIKIIDALNNVTEFEYSAVGNLLRTTDRNGIVTKNEYDDLHRLEPVPNKENHNL